MRGEGDSGQQVLARGGNSLISSVDNELERMKALVELFHLR
jgi:hypothetical protein